MVIDPDFYLQRARKFSAEAAVLEGAVRQLALSRLALAIVLAALIYLGWVDAMFFFAIPVGVVLFFYLVKRQSKKEAERAILLQLVRLNEWEAAAGRHDFGNFPDGARFADPHHPFSHDLDIFGHCSLFQYLNRCATGLGEQQLADNLTQLDRSEASILLRQEALRELGPMIAFRQRCWATGQQIADRNFSISSLVSWLQQPELIQNKKRLFFLRWVLPALTCIALIGISFFAWLKPVFLVLAVAQLGIAAVYNKRISRIQSELSAHRLALANFSRLFRLMSAETFHAAEMRQHHQVAHRATGHLQEFAALINALESRMNLIARIFGNGLFLYDFHAVHKLETWRARHSEDVQGWLASLATWDALLSLSTYHYNHPTYAFGTVSATLSIRGTAVGHPLIPAGERIANDFDLGNPARLMLVTGANMAGKSTFLRTIGINQVLALNGAPVCARAWSSPAVELRSGMRTADSLQEHQSYFYAELHRLQAIMTELRTGKQMLILLDEILKGTNSTDKQAGSRELIKQLIQHPALVLLATHDISLGDLAAQFPDQIVNTCFEGTIEAGQLAFDYTLHAGIAQKANATFLMRKMGIIP